MTTEPERIAKAFADILGDWLTANQWAEMLAKNASPAYGGPVCASHDYCDSNMAMAEAFESVMGREPASSFETHYDATAGEHVADNPAEEAQCTADSALWNAAWTIAKPRYLTTPGAPQYDTNPALEALKAKVAALRIKESDQ